MEIIYKKFKRREMRQSRIKKLAKRDWMNRTFSKKYNCYSYIVKLWKNECYTNNEEGA